MKATELTAPGFYWCSHNLNWTTGFSSYPEEWSVVEVMRDSRHGDALVLYTIGGDDAEVLAELPSYVWFVGPLQPPA